MTEGESEDMDVQQLNFDSDGKDEFDLVNSKLGVADNSQPN